ncbi:MAG: cupin domain-containing protein [SAR202 cluster bacterium]|nr:cupin domain-containing protein [SAR202 cluster bacterium]
MPYFYKSSAVPKRELIKGATLRTMWGDKIMMSLLETDPHSVIPIHTHPHEQAGIVMEGEFEMTIGDEVRHMKPGDCYVIPGGVPHGVKGYSMKAVALDIFSPPREEYKPETKKVTSEWKEVKK